MSEVIGRGAYKHAVAGHDHPGCDRAIDRRQVLHQPSVHACTRNGIAVHWMDAQRVLILGGALGEVVLGRHHHNMNDAVVE